LKAPHELLDDPLWHGGILSLWVPVRNDDAKSPYRSCGHTTMYLSRRQIVAPNADRY